MLMAFFVLTLADHDKRDQRAIFQLLDVHVILNLYGNLYREERWADVTCALGHKRCAVECSITKFRGADNLVATSSLASVD